MMANVITGLRILVSAALLFCPVFSPIFYVLYLIAGLSDMVDGIIARKTNSASEFESRFDSIADYIFVAVCLIILHLYIFIADGLQTVYELCFHFIF
jgi:CDP-diacylglycerol--glycerol-3-phosphate 3-phosphatidyltransferase